MILNVQKRWQIWLLCVHIGVQSMFMRQTDYQKYWTNVFLEEGVDLVLGTHPHVIEPVEEFYKGRWF